MKQELIGPFAQTQSLASPQTEHEKRPEQVKTVLRIYSGIGGPSSSPLSDRRRALWGSKLSCDIATTVTPGGFGFSRFNRCGLCGRWGRL